MFTACTFNNLCQSTFSDMMKMDKSKPWPQALKKLTGSETLDVGALTEYFEPLRKWMVEQREEIGYAAPGWGEEDDIAITEPCALVALAVFFL